MLLYYNICGSQTSKGKSFVKTVHRRVVMAKHTNHGETVTTHQQFTLDEKEMCLSETDVTRFEKTKQRVLLHGEKYQPVVKGLCAKATEAAEMCGMFTHFIPLVNRLALCDAGTASESLKKNY